MEVSTLRGQETSSAQTMHSFSPSIPPLLPSPRSAPTPTPDPLCGAALAARHMTTSRWNCPAPWIRRHLTYPYIGLEWLLHWTLQHYCTCSSCLHTPHTTHFSNRCLAERENIGKFTPFPNCHLLGTERWRVAFSFRFSQQCSGVPISSYHCQHLLVSVSIFVLLCFVLIISAYWV